MTPAKRSVVRVLFGFITVSALILATGCASAPHSSSQAKPQGSEPGDGAFPVIDAHTHTHFTNEINPWGKLMDSQEEYLKELKSIGAVGAVVHTNQTRSDYHDLSKWGVIDCAGTGTKVNSGEIEAGLKDGRFKCIKVYLGYEKQYAYDRGYDPVYALAEKYHVPVVFHTGDTNDTKALLKYADPLTIDEVAVRHPNVKMVIAHCGNPWIESAAEVAYKNPNVYLDGSAFLTGDLTKEPPGEVDEYVVKPIAWVFGYLEDPTKLMYGTDWPLTTMKPYLEAFKKAIPREYWRQVFFENAKAVFPFPKDLGTPQK